MLSMKTLNRFIAYTMVITALVCTGCVTKTGNDFPSSVTEGGSQKQADDRVDTIDINPSVMR